MYDTNHLDALNARVSNEKARLAAATSAKEIEFRKHVVAMAEKEVAGELEFLKARGVDVSVYEMSDDDLLAELLG